MTFAAAFENLRCAIARPFFVQIGANDGHTLDDLGPLARRWQLSGIVVEPQADEFRKLQEVYAGHDVACEQAAITTSNGAVQMYRPRRELAASSSLRATLRPGLVKEHCDPFTARGITVEALAIKYNILRVDLLQVDTEGCDGRIVRDFLLFGYRPGVIHYEHAMLPAWERFCTRLMLRRQHYTLTTTGINTVAIKCSTFPI